MILDPLQIGTWLLAGWLLIGILHRGDAVLPAAGCLAAAAGALLWQSFSPWMPSDQQSAIVKAAVTVLAFSSFAVMMSRRSPDLPRALIASFGAVAIGGVVLRSDLGEYRSMMVLAAIVLAAIAVAVLLHIPLARRVLARESREAAASVHTLWTTATTWVVLLSCGSVALWLQPLPLWGRVLLQVGCTAAGIALVAVATTIALMCRHPGFAAAYSVAMSKTLIDVRMAMLTGVVLLSPAAALPGVALSLGAGPDVVRLVLGGASAWVVVGTWRVLRLIRREALRRRRTTMTGPASTAVRDLASDDPVYRLLPGMRKKRD